MNNENSIELRIPSWHGGIFSVAIARSQSDNLNGNQKMIAVITNTKTEEKHAIESYCKSEFEELISNYITESLHETKRNSHEEILKYGLLYDSDSIFEGLKSNGEFHVPNPEAGIVSIIENIEKPVDQCGPEPMKEQFPPAPSRIRELRLKFAGNDDEIASIKNDMERESIEKFQKAHDDWLANKVRIESEIDEYNRKKKELEESIPELVKEWNAQKDAFYRLQKSINQPLDDIRQAYAAGNPESIKPYLNTILGAARYPDGIENSFELEYFPSIKCLIIDASLPNNSQTPQRTGVYSSHGGLKLKELSSSAKKKIYESVIYQMMFRILHTLYSADYKQFIDGIVFNGWVDTIDVSTGRPNTICIASIHFNRGDFDKLDLKNIDPKSCFKAFRGVSANELSAMAAVPPIMAIPRSDRRFIESKAIIESVQSGTNLAAMNWEDFEHLIREIFESEFKANGGEVKVTQASRDGGVDAIAFDPDPIRGGKIVIQAKRYTNTVGVSAIRDLYGTILNEGATKGVLVTTSDFGSDSYEFAKGKPITLLNGSNLLYLLEKHGHKARIDIKEAKALAKQDLKYL